MSTAQPAVVAGQKLEGAEAHAYLDRLEDGLQEAAIGYSGVLHLRDAIDRGEAIVAPFAMAAAG